MGDSSSAEEQEEGAGGTWHYLGSRMAKWRGQGASRRSCPTSGFRYNPTCIVASHCKYTHMQTTVYYLQVKSSITISGWWHQSRFWAFSSSRPEWVLIAPLHYSSPTYIWTKRDTAAVMLQSHKHSTATIQFHKLKGRFLTFFTSAFELHKSLLRIYKIHHRYSFTAFTKHYYITKQNKCW